MTFNSNTLVIHPNDNTTKFLSVIYTDKNFTVINDNVSKKELKHAIKSHDRIIFLGHGTEHGLIGFNRCIIDSTLVYLLRDKINVYIWCNADKFVKKYNLKGFYSGMIISEYDEAEYFLVEANYDDIAISNKLFTEALAVNIDDLDMREGFHKIYDGDNPIIDYNKKNIYYID